MKVLQKKREHQLCSINFYFIFFDEVSNLVPTGFFKEEIMFEFGEKTNCYNANCVRIVWLHLEIQRGRGIFEIFSNIV
jgi:hypothetical protein